MRKHNARTVQQLIDAAMQGEQFPCGTIADCFEADPKNHHKCTRCNERRALMTATYKQGMQDAQDRIALYDERTRQQEYRNAIAAYEAIPAVEPAISYLVGYAGALPMPH